jgi:hypothetical protein
VILSNQVTVNAYVPRLLLLTSLIYFLREHYSNLFDEQCQVTHRFADAIVQKRRQNLRAWEDLIFVKSREICSQ